ncbi:hypothetical protein [Sutcliffiella cohnii]|uniref:hypothetical protein n=1 Tax=Sutcliffiella cohnii TaxID=33932 RepID=UPI002E1CB997|nr:hypothetical protein [Sutcliffiella cohnii]
MIKERYLWLFIILIFISAVGNYLFFQSKQINEPVFMKHYYVKEYMEEDPEVRFSLYYLVNKHNPVTITSVRVDDSFHAYTANENFGFWHHSNQISYEQQFTHHYLMTSTLTVRLDSEIVMNNPSFSFQEVTVHLSDGTTQTVNIGEIKIHPIMERNETNVVEQRLSVSSNDHKRENFFIPLETIRINNVMSPFDEFLENKIKMKIDTDHDRVLEAYRKWNSHHFRDFANQTWDQLPGAPLTKANMPISIDEGYWANITTITYQDFPSYIDFPIEVVGETESGNSFNFPIYMSDRPYWDQVQINELIKKDK